MNRCFEKSRRIFLTVVRSRSGRLMGSVDMGCGGYRWLGLRCVAGSHPALSTQASAKRSKTISWLWFTFHPGTVARFLIV